MAIECASPSSCDPFNGGGSQQAMAQPGGRTTMSDSQQRLEILTEIVLSIERKQPQWDKNRVLGRATDIEETLWRTATAMHEYADLTTLPKRIEAACLSLVLARKGDLQLRAAAVAAAAAEAEAAAQAAAAVAQQPQDDDMFDHSYDDDEDHNVKEEPVATAPVSGSGSGSGHHSARGGASHHHKPPPHEEAEPEDEGARLQGQLLHLLHARTCADPACTLLPRCAATRALLPHVAACADDLCAVPQCVAARALLRHNAACTSTGCSLCAPARATLATLEFKKRANEHKARLLQLQEERKRKREAAEAAGTLKRPIAQRPRRPSDADTMLVTDAAGHAIGRFGPGFFVRQAAAAAAAASSASARSASAPPLQSPAAAHDGDDAFPRVSGDDKDVEEERGERAASMPHSFALASPPSAAVPSLTRGALKHVGAAALLADGAAAPRTADGN